MNVYHLRNIFSIIEENRSSCFYYKNVYTTYHYDDVNQYLLLHIRAVGRSENAGVPVLFGGHNLPLLVEIGLTDLPQSGGSMAPPAPPGTTPLHI